MTSIFRKLSFKENRRRYKNIKGIITRRYAYKGPDIVQIDLTDRCNSHCLLCWNHSPLSGSGATDNLNELSYSLVRNLIDELSVQGAKEIIFSGGGEPFLHPDIWKILDYTQMKGLCFRINTNLTLIKEEDIKKLLSYDKMVSLTVSIWTVDENKYCEIHGRENRDFLMAKVNLKKINTLKSPGLEVKLYSVISKINYLELKALAEFAALMGCTSVEFGVMDVIPGITDKYLLGAGELGILKKSLIDIAKTSKIKIHNQVLFLKRISAARACYGEYDDFIDKIPCYVGWLFLRVRANGDFNSCLKSHRAPVGNIHKNNFDYAWGGEKQRNFREMGTRIPRNEKYFSCIGNSRDKIGCNRLCDNVLLNQQMRRIMVFLPFLMKK